ncbi:MAG: hypothetical protein WAO90_16360 [Mycobacterium sp.]
MFRDHVSLMHGWVPVTAQILAAVLLMAGPSAAPGPRPSGVR